MPPSPARPLFPSPRCLELREGEIEGRIQSSTSNASHAPPSDPAPFVTALAEAAHLHPKAWQSESWEKEMQKRERRGETSKCPPHTHWVSLKKLVNASTWEGSGSYRSTPRATMSGFYSIFFFRIPFKIKVSKITK